MADYNVLKAAIADYVKDRTGLSTIDGDGLQETLLAMVNSLGAGYQFIDVATPSTNPGTPDQNVFYIAAEPGTYTNFPISGGYLQLAENEVAIFKYNGQWSKETTGAATADAVNQLGQKVGSRLSNTVTSDGVNQYRNTISFGVTLPAGTKIRVRFTTASSLQFGLRALLGENVAESLENARNGYDSVLTVNSDFNAIQIYSSSTAVITATLDVAWGDRMRIEINEEDIADNTHEIGILSEYPKEMDCAESRFIGVIENVRFGGAQTIISDGNFVINYYKLKKGDVVPVHLVKTDTVMYVGTCTSTPAVGVSVTLYEGVFAGTYDFRIEAAQDEYLLFVRHKTTQNVTITFTISSPTQMGEISRINEREVKQLICDAPLYGDGGRNSFYIPAVFKQGDKITVEIITEEGGSASVAEWICALYLTNQYTNTNIGAVAAFYAYEDALKNITIAQDGVISYWTHFTGDNARLRIYKYVDAVERLDGVDRAIFDINGGSLIDRLVAQIYSSAIVNTQVFTPASWLCSIVSGICTDGAGNVFVAGMSDKTQTMESGTNAFAGLTMFNIIRPWEAKSFDAIKKNDVIENYDGDGNDLTISYTSDAMCAYISASCVRVFAQVAGTLADESTDAIFAYVDFNPSTEQFSAVKAATVSNGLLMNYANMLAIKADNNLEEYTPSPTQPNWEFMFSNTNFVKIGTYWYSFFYTDKSGMIMRSSDCIDWEFCFDTKIGSFVVEVALGYDGTNLYLVNRSDYVIPRDCNIIKYDLSDGSIVSKLPLPLYWAAGVNRPAMAIRNGYAYILIYEESKNTDNVSINGVSAGLLRSAKALFRVKLSTMEIDKRIHLTPQIRSVSLSLYCVGTAMYIFTNTDKRGFGMSIGSDGRQESGFAYFDTEMLDLCNQYTPSETLI